LVVISIGAYEQLAARYTKINSCDFGKGLYMLAQKYINKIYEMR
jgi:hypothetical protein